ncbi:APC family permease [Streptomyces cavernicola]|uniref:APC family permease n=1 Tax=Streptomyces cavernicola TaxID=3043613 RepID=A0ABT6SBW1_9ACTN|nr:APC family permease [Streptomyces sp. B-S-A6]MDI3405676.1 APC family permease [Streptomyces sp. B-S-A6]
MSPSQERTGTTDATTSADSTSADSTGAGGLAGGRLGVAGIVFFVISAAAPLTVLVSGAPLTIRLGGIGAPGAIVACGIVLILFSCGFTAMSRHVRNAGAFYAYVTRGLGRSTGAGVALTTMSAYALLLLGFYGFIGYFAAETAEDLLGVDLPWGVWALATLALVGLLGFRQVDVGAKVLAVLLTAEVGLLLVLSLAVLAKGGPEPVSFASFSPAHVYFASGAGSLFVLGFGSYIGFEGTAIYAEEAKRPERTVPVATYIAIAFLAGFYAFTYWTVIVAFGVEGVVAAAGADDFGDMLFAMSGDYLGTSAVVLMRVLIVTSFVACVIAFHNACARYLFALGREGLLPRALARTHRRLKSPYAASHTLTAVAAVAVLLALAAGLDPYLQFGIWTYSSGVVGIVVAQAVCALSMVAFFGRDRRGHSSSRVLVAPALGALGLIVGVVLIVTNFEVVTGQTGLANWLMLLPTPVLFLAGVVLGLLRRGKAPAGDSAGQTLATVPSADDSRKRS